MPQISLKRDPPTMYLGMELIPKSAWYINVRSKLPKDDWDILRKHVYAQADYQCQICGGVGSKWPVECHEKWEWDDIKGVQKLVGLLALCPKCHQVKHMGHSQAVMSRTALMKLYSHQRRINKWKKLQQLLYFEKVRARQERRNARSWTVDISYAKLLLHQIKEGIV